MQEILEAEIEKAYKAGYLGKNIFGSGFDCDVFMHRGAGAYEAGEETALIESLEGKRAQPRLKPPFPAVAGLYQCPTAVNNVETLCNVPLIVLNGAEWFAKLGPEKNGGPKLYCVSGHVKKPGVYEASMNTTLRELIYDYAGGIRGDRPLKAIIPGGSSVPLLLPDQLDTPASFDAMQKAGSLLGSAGLIVLDDSVCMVWLAMNLLHFYRHESCGKCTPCREGGDWLYKLLLRLERGEGQAKDLDLLFGVANNIVGKTLCAFGDAAATPVLSTMKLFRAEYEAHVREGRCTLTGRLAREAAALRGGPLMGHATLWASFDPYLRPSVIGLMIFVVFNALIIASAILVLAERKIMGFMQQRYGPYLVGPHGMLQPIADILKLLFKEELRPKGADRWLFTLAPMISVIAAFTAFATVPFGAETTFFGLLDDAGQAWCLRRQRRRARRLRGHLDGRLRHRPRRLVVQQQVLAAGRAARVGADDQLRAGVCHGARLGGHAGRVAVAARSRRFAVGLLVGIHPALVPVPAAARLHHLRHCGRCGNQSRAV